MTGAAIIVGASHGGVQAAVSLRQSGWQEPILLFSAEPDLPYHRPPLSKAFLAGDKTEEQIQLRSLGFYADQQIELHLDEPVLSLDAGLQRIVTKSKRYDYTKLILATGATARRLPVPGGDLAGIHTLRDLADSRRLKTVLEKAERVAVVGGGFIGLEFASTAIKSGKPTTVIEAQNRLLTRSLPASVADFLGAFHQAKGVRFIFGAGIEAFEEDAGRVSAVRLSDGARIEADLVLVGIGGAANLQLAKDAGLTIESGGVLVDAHGRTSAPDIYAIGDLAAFHNDYASAPMRLESVQNAVDQARSAAAHAAGGDTPLSAVPWFWTDQYELKVQMAGLPVPGCSELMRGDPQSASFSLLQLFDGHLVAAYSVNRGADHMAARRLIASAAPLDLAIAADAQVPLLKAADDDSKPAPRLHSKQS